MTTPSRSRCLGVACSIWLTFAIAACGEPPAAASPPLDLTGLYDMTITAADTCGALPAEARLRSYRAPMTKVPNTSPPRFTIELGGANFFQGFSTIHVWLSGNFVRVFIGRPIDLFEETAIAEELRPDDFVLLQARSLETAVRPSDTVITANLIGSIEYCPGAVNAGPYLVCSVTPTRCQSGLHQLTLTRR
jgi:hypothetical protein